MRFRASFSRSFLKIAACCLPELVYTRPEAEAPTLAKDAVVIINQSGRGDKDIFTIADAFDDPGWRAFIIDKARQYEEKRTPGH